jgi:hypothetical protein
VSSAAESSATKIETQHGKPEGMKRLHGMKDHFVVHGSAEHRVRMANQSRMCGIRRAHIEQRLESAGWAVDKQRADGSVWSRQIDNPRARMQTIIIFHAILIASWVGANDYNEIPRAIDHELKSEKQ